MITIKELYRIGYGPSSSHTMGPHFASEIFLQEHPDAKKIEVTLYGSLAATGRGHLTDVAILNTLEPHAEVEIVWQPKIFLPFHPNGMKFRAMDENGNTTDEWTVYSVGGGALAEEGEPKHKPDDIYDMDHMSDILRWCRRTGYSYWEYVEKCEGKEIWDYLREVWQTMRESVERGLDAEGVLPGPLNLARKAAAYHIKATGYTGSKRFILRHRQTYPISI